MCITLREVFLITMIIFLCTEIYLLSVSFYGAIFPYPIFQHCILNETYITSGGHMKATMYYDGGSKLVEIVSMPYTPNQTCWQDTSFFSKNHQVVLYENPQTGQIVIKCAMWLGCLALTNMIYKFVKVNYFGSEKNQNYNVI